MNAEVRSQTPETGLHQMVNLFLEIKNRKCKEPAQRAGRGISLHVNHSFVFRKYVIKGRQAAVFFDLIH